MAPGTGLRLETGYRQTPAPRPDEAHRDHLHEHAERLAATIRPGLSRHHGSLRVVAIDYHGNFWIEQAGEYRFSLLSDDGARLAIDNQEFVNNDGIHAASALRQCRAFPRCPHDQRLLLSGAPLRRGAPAAQGSGRMGHGQDRPSAEIRAHRPGALTHSGSGLPLVSGANGNAAKPTKNTRHIVTPA